jgi:antitoxin ParD1/3/4
MFEGQRLTGRDLYHKLVLIGIRIGYSVARNTSISLGDHFSDFISKQVETGRYGSASDVVRAGLRLLEEHEARVKALEAALIAGEKSGAPVPLESKAFLKKMRAKHAK